MGGPRPGEAASAAGPGAAVQGGRRCSAGPGARRGAPVGPYRVKRSARPGRERRIPGLRRAVTAGPHAAGPGAAGCAVPVCPGELPRPPCAPGWSIHSSHLCPEAAHPHRAGGSAPSASLGREGLNSWEEEAPHS